MREIKIHKRHKCMICGLKPRVDLEDENKKLKAQLESIKETITFYTKRSNYMWSERGGYDQYDWQNEGAIVACGLLLRTFFSEDTLKKIEELWK